MHLESLPLHLLPRKLSIPFEACKAARTAKIQCEPEYCISIVIPSETGTEMGKCVCAKCQGGVVEKWRREEQDRIRKAMEIGRVVGGGEEDEGMR